MRKAAVQSLSLALCLAMVWPRGVWAVQENSGSAESDGEAFKLPETPAPMGNESLGEGLADSLGNASSLTGGLPAAEVQPADDLLEDAVPSFQASDRPDSDSAGHPEDDIDRIRPTIVTGFERQLKEILRLSDDISEPSALDSTFDNSDPRLQSPSTNDIVLFPGPHNKDVADKKYKEWQARLSEDNAHRQEIRLEKRKEAFLKGQDLEKWGLPNKISVEGDGHLRYAVLYRMGGFATNLGLALHELLEPLVAQNPTILKNINTIQLHDAVKILEDSLPYRVDPNSDDVQKLINLGMVVNRGYDYEMERQALASEARAALLKSFGKPHDVSAGLGLKTPEQRPTLVLKQVVEETIGRYQREAAAGASDAQLGPIKKLLFALHAIMGMALSTNAGPQMEPVRHNQMPVLQAELKKRGVLDDVIYAILRAFPLGDSLLRLAAHKMWERGIMGRRIRIGVIDDGLDVNHPDLKDAVTLRNNFTRDQRQDTVGPHMTRIVGIIHAVTPEAEIYSYKVLSNSKLPGVKLSLSETTAAVVNSLEQAAADGCRVINMSMHLPGEPYFNDVVSKKIKELRRRGIIVVAAAGNAAREQPNGFQVDVPAASPDVIAVGSVNNHKEKNDTSSSGLTRNPDTHETVEKPNIYSYGDSQKSAVPLDPLKYIREMLPYDDVSGNSPAAAFITGSIALMLDSALEKNLSCAPEQLFDAVLSALLAGSTTTPHLPVLESIPQAADALLATLRSQKKN